MKSMVTTDLAYFLAGVVAGGAAALLMAPASGVETRSQIRDGIENGTIAVRNKKAEVAGQIDEAVQAGKDAVRAGKDRLHSELHRLDAAVEAGKQAYQKAAEV